MKKIFQYILMAVALVATASCSNELDDTLQPANNSNLQFVVSDFPAFGEGAQTRAIGTPDAGKTKWVNGDAIFVHLYSSKYGNQVVILTFNAEKSTWTPSGTLNYLENETPAVTAVYAPGCKVSENNIVLEDNQVYGMSEYIHADTNIEDNTLRISFEGVKRHYSRLRIVAEAGQTLTVTTTGFIPAGPEGTTAPNSYTLVTDTPNGNAFLYGTFAEGATVSVKQGDVTLKDYTFTAEKNPNGTEPGKSYALDTRPIFSVSVSKKVLFSPGNLQYTQSTDTWSFAENQWDYIGTDNVTGGTVYFRSSDGYRKYGDDLADKIDLFGWSGSTGSVKFGVSTSIDYKDYSGSFVDWGTNQIGTDAPNIWRTLTSNEWSYVVLGRSNADNLNGVAQVNEVNGLILLPDNWICPSGVTFKSGFHSEESVEAYGKYQTFTTDQWSKLEKSGAVFLPASGNRNNPYNSGSDVEDVQSKGSYWSATESSGAYTHCLIFKSDQEAYMGNGSLNDGRSVRLVKDL